MKEEFRRQDEVEMYRLGPSKRLRVAPCMLDQVFAHYGGHFVSMVAAGDDTFLLLDDLSGHSGDGRHVMLTADVVNSSSQLMKTVTEFLVGAARGNFALYRRNDPPPLSRSAPLEDPKPSKQLLPECNHRCFSCNSRAFGSRHGEVPR